MFFLPFLHFFAVLRPFSLPFPPGFSPLLCPLLPASSRLRFSPLLCPLLPTSPRFFARFSPLLSPLLPRFFPQFSTFSRFRAVFPFFESSFCLFEPFFPFSFHFPHFFYFPHFFIFGVQLLLGAPKAQTHLKILTFFPLRMFLGGKFENITCSMFGFNFRRSLRVHKMLTFGCGFGTRLQKVETCMGNENSE